MVRSQHGQFWFLQPFCHIDSIVASRVCPVNRRPGAIPGCDRSFWLWTRAPRPLAAGSRSSPETKTQRPFPRMAVDRQAELHHDSCNDQCHRPPIPGGRVRLIAKRRGAGVRGRWTCPHLIAGTVGMNPRQAVAVSDHRRPPHRRHPAPPRPRPLDREAAGGREGFRGQGGRIAAADAHVNPSNARSSLAHLPPNRIVRYGRQPQAGVQ